MEASGVGARSRAILRGGGERRRPRIARKRAPTHGNMSVGPFTVSGSTEEKASGVGARPLAGDMTGVW